MLFDVTLTKPYMLLRPMFRVVCAMTVNTTPWATIVSDVSHFTIVIQIDLSKMLMSVNVCLHFTFYLLNF